MNYKLKMSIGMGIPSIIMIFVVLCLTTLGCLSLITAKADWKLTQKNASFLKAYYNAENSVEVWLADVDATLHAGQMPQSTVYRVAVSKTQDLVITIKIDGQHYQVISQKLVPNSQWNYDEYQNEFGTIKINE